jgi:GntR family transcriptional regulator of arabinose operon
MDQILLNNEGKSAGLRRDLMEAIESGTLRIGEKIASLRSLARKYGISYPTASKVIHGLVKNGFLVTEQGSGVYVANRRSGSVYGALGVLGIEKNYWEIITQGKAQNHIWSRMLRGFSEECLRGESMMTLIPSGSDERIYADAAKVASAPVDGIFLLRYLDDKELFLQALASGKTLVAANETARKSHLPFVDFNHAAPLRRAVAYLREKGLRRVALAMEDVRDAEISERAAAAFAESARESGLEFSITRKPFDETGRNPVGFSFGAEVVRESLARANQPEAFVFKGDRAAEDGISELRTRNLRIPADISVVCDCPMESPFFAGQEEKYTRFPYPAEEIGRQAAIFLLQAPRQREKLNLLVSSELIRGDSA